VPFARRNSEVTPNVRMHVNWAHHPGRRGQSCQALLRPIDNLPQRHLARYPSSKPIDVRRVPSRQRPTPDRHPGSVEIHHHFPPRLVIVAFAATVEQRPVRVEHQLDLVLPGAPTRIPLRKAGPRSHCHRNWHRTVTGPNKDCLPEGKPYRQVVFNAAFGNTDDP